MKFNTGDRVLCRDAKRQKGVLVEGRIYEVLAVAEGNVYLKSSPETAPRWFWDSRFELVDSGLQTHAVKREDVANDFANEVLYRLTKEGDSFKRRLEQRDELGLLSSEIDSLKIKIGQCEYFIGVVQSLMIAYEIKPEDAK